MRMKSMAPLLLAGWVACEVTDTRTATGTIEFTRTDVAAMVPARVVRVLVEEGQSVAAGDTIAVLSQTGLPQDIEQRRARVASAQAQLRDLERGARPQEIQRAEAELRVAESEAQRTAADTVRLVRLLASGGISQSAFDVAVTAARVASDRRDAVREALLLLRAGARPEQVEAARAAVRTARAQLAMGEAAVGALVLTAPAHGQVLARYAEPGEVLAAGVPVVSLGDARSAWIRVYVAPALFASIHPGDSVRITVDGLEGRSFGARVTAMATAAEFTPRVALTEKERADLLFGVKLELSDTTGTLKAGLPATAHFERQDGSPQP